VTFVSGETKIKRHTGHDGYVSQASTIIGWSYYKTVICFVLIENQRWPSLQDKILAKNNTVWESS
jgi:hypothetical protein